MLLIHKRGKVPVEYCCFAIRSDLPGTYPTSFDWAAEELHVPIKIFAAMRPDDPYQHADARPVSTPTDDRHIARFAAQFPC